MCENTVRYVYSDSYCQRTADLGMGVARGGEDFLNILLHS